LSKDGDLYPQKAIKHKYKAAQKAALSITKTLTDYLEATV